jgi:hypothetical protein
LFTRKERLKEYNVVRMTQSDMSAAVLSLNQCTFAQMGYVFKELVHYVPCWLSDE